MAGDAVEGGVLVVGWDIRDCAFWCLCWLLVGERVRGLGGEVGDGSGGEGWGRVWVCMMRE